MKSPLLVHHVINAATVSGPETLIGPNLSPPQWISNRYGIQTEILLLQESRVADAGLKVRDYFLNLGFKVHEFPVNRPYDPRTVRLLGQFWKSNPPQIIHMHGPKSSLFSWRAAYHLRSTALISTHHGVRAFRKSVKLRFYAWIYEKIILPKIKQTLTVCNSDRDLLIQKGLKANQVTAHLNGTDRAEVPTPLLADRKHEIRAAWIHELRIPDLGDSYVFGLVGRLALEKNHSFAFQVMKALREKSSLGKKVILLCFGSGELESELKTLVQSQRLENTVFFGGYRSTIGSEMAGFDLILSPSLCEGLPINLIEAGWAGTPVAAFAVDGINDLIPSGEYGYARPPQITPEEFAAGLVQVVRDGQSIGARFQARVREQFSKNAWLEHLQKIYEENLP